MVKNRCDVDGKNECGCGRNGWEKWNNGCGEKKRGDRPEEPSQQQKTHETHDKRRDRYLRYDNLIC